MEAAVRKRRKAKQGIVISNKMDKTVVVSTEIVKKHPLYKKVIRRRKKYYAHDEANALNVGDQVTIVESRPFSKLKKWRVVNPTSDKE